LIFILTLEKASLVVVVVFVSAVVKGSGFGYNDLKFNNSKYIF